MTTTALPERMSYVACDGGGDVDVMRVASGPLPPLRPSDVLIRVRAAGLNRVDVQQRRGGYKPPLGATDVLGVEVAGEVVAVGVDVTAQRVGDRVCALVEGGGYATYCAAHARQCLPWPRGFDAVQAAALPETYFTVWANLFHTGLLRPGETLLVHGGTSGIGTTAIQLARAFGAVPFATAGTGDKCAACMHLGAEAAIAYRTEDFVARIDALTDRRGVDVVLDIVGGPYVARNLQCLARKGRLVMLAFLEGAVAERLDFGRLLVRHLTITGSTLRPRSANEKGALADALRERVWPLLDAGRCLPVIDSTFPLDRVRDAHARMESSVHVGKIVLEVP